MIDYFAEDYPHWILHYKNSNSKNSDNRRLSSFFPIKCSLFWMLLISKCNKILNDFIRYFKQKSRTIQKDYLILQRYQSLWARNLRYGHFQFFFYYVSGSWESIVYQQGSTRNKDIHLNHTVLETTINNGSQRHI